MPDHHAVCVNILRIRTFVLLLALGTDSYACIVAGPTGMVNTNQRGV